MTLATRFHSIPVGGLPCWQSRPSLTRRRLLAVANADVLPGSSCGACIVWYKHDLRVDDHPGLVAAASQQRTLASSRGFGLPGCWWGLAIFQWGRFSIALRRLTSPHGMLYNEQFHQRVLTKLKGA